MMISLGNAPARPHSNWVEPLNITLPPLPPIDTPDADETFHKIIFSLCIIQAVDKKLLSDTALGAIDGLSRLKTNKDWASTSISAFESEYGTYPNKSQHNEGWILPKHRDTSTLLDASFIVLEQSYYMASSSSIDQPQLSIKAIIALGSLSEILPHEDASRAKNILIKISQFDDLALSRVYLYLSSTSLHLNKKLIMKDSFLSHVNNDLKILLKRKFDHAFLVVYAISNIIQNMEVIGETSHYLELLYLLAEFHLSKNRYKIVISIPSYRQDMWNKSIDDPMHESVCRKIRLCLAQALEFSGDLKSALALYELIKYDEDYCDSLRRCISGEPYWSLEEVHGTVNKIEKTLLDVIELEKDTYLMLMECISRNSIEIHKLKSGILQQAELNFKWNIARMVPDIIDGKVLFLVSLQTSSTDKNSAVLARVEFMFGGSKSSEHNQYLRLWSFDVSRSIFSEIQTWGCAPKDQAIAFSGSHCIKLGNSIILFGSYCEHIHILNLKNLQWSKVSHPYQGSFMIKSTPTLPRFSCAIPYTKKQQDSVLLLYPGEESQNKKHGEYIPKFSVDEFLQEEISSNHLSCNRYQFNINLSTIDRNGYKANHVNSVAVAIDSVILILGSNLMTTPLLEANCDFKEAKGLSTLTALNLKTMEWRDLSIHNSSLVETSCCSKPGKFIYSKYNNCCYLFQWSENGFKKFCLNNVSNLEKYCLKKSLSEKKQFSRKKTLAHHMKKAEKYLFEPAKECLLCGKLESKNMTLQKCTACKRARYCSKECQRAHWKIHKKECVLICD